MNETTKIVLFEVKNDCCGCYSCFSACPTSAIQMVEDNEGFVYPKIDIDKCVKCTKCMQVCPIIKVKNVTS